MRVAPASGSSLDQYDQSWFAPLVQGYCLMRVPFAVDHPGMSTHLPEWRATSRWEPPEARRSNCWFVPLPQVYILIVAPSAVEALVTSRHLPDCCDTILT